MERHFKECLKAAMKRAGYTSEELAEKTDDIERIISSRTIKAWRDGQIKEPSATSLRTLSKVLNVSTDYLLGLTDIPTPDPDMQMVSKTTRLSTEAIDKLSTYNAETIEFLSTYLICEGAETLFIAMQNYMKAIIKYGKMPDAYHYTMSARSYVNQDAEKKYFEELRAFVDATEMERLKLLDVATKLHWDVEYLATMFNRFVRSLRK